MKRLASRFDVVAYAAPQEHLAVNAAERRDQPWIILASTCTRGKARSMIREGATGHDKPAPLRFVVFFLGHQAVDDFWDIVLLAAHARGFGAMKLLRALLRYFLRYFFGELSAPQGFQAVCPEARGLPGMRTRSTSP